MFVLIQSLVLQLISKVNFFSTGNPPAPTIEGIPEPVVQTDHSNLIHDAVPPSLPSELTDAPPSNRILQPSVPMCSHNVKKETQPSSVCIMSEKQYILPVLQEPSLSVCGNSQCLQMTFNLVVKPL